jgi:hypothetical protein
MQQARASTPICRKFDVVGSNFESVLYENAVSESRWKRKVRVIIDYGESARAIANGSGP